MSPHGDMDASAGKQQRWGLGDDIGQDRSGGQNRSGGPKDKLAQSSGSVEDRSGGRSRDVSPASEGGLALSRAPGDSNVSCEEEEANAEEERPAGFNTTPLPVAGRSLRDPHRSCGESVGRLPLAKCSPERSRGCRQYRHFFGHLGRITEQTGAECNNTSMPISTPMPGHWSHRVREGSRGIAAQARICRWSDLGGDPHIPGWPRTSYLARKRNRECSCGSTVRSCG